MVAGLEPGEWKGEEVVDVGSKGGIMPDVGRYVLAKVPCSMAGTALDNPKLALQTGC